MDACVSVSCTSVKKKAFIHAGPLWLLHGIGTNNGGHHVAIMANAPLTSHALKTSEPQQWIPLAEISRSRSHIGW
jgi:hypothetical protein